MSAGLLYPASMKNRNILWTLLALIAFSALVRGTFWVIGLIHIPPTADECIAALQGLQIVRGEEFPLLMMGQPYLFPLESYLAAPLLWFLPHTAFGARLTPFLMGWAGLAFGLLILRNWCGNWKNALPGVVLVLFPSAYLMVLQTSFALPGYPAFLFLGLLAVWLVQQHQKEEGSRRAALWALAGGVVAGLVCSVTLMALPVLAVVLAALCLSTSRRKALLSTPAALLGVALGMLPHYLAKMLYPGAYGAVSSLIPWSKAFARLWEPTLTYTLPSALGVNPCLFPDTDQTFSLWPALVNVTGPAWLVFMVGITILCAVRFIARWRENRWPSFEMPDLFAGISWACLILFIVNYRSHSTTFRYLLPAAWAFPFLVGSLFKQPGPRLRAVLLVVVLALAGFNVATAIGLMRHWSQPRFAEKVLKLWRVEPVVERMKQLGLHTAYATYLDAYRITYASEGDITCAQPYNERFFGWKLPYKEDVVDPSERAAYALANGWRFQYLVFERDCRDMNIQFMKDMVGDWQLYHTFREAEPRSELELDLSNVTITSSCHPEDVDALIDGNYVTRWRSHQAQKAGMWVQLNFPEPVTLNRLSMYYNYYHVDRARQLRIKVRDPDGKMVIHLDNIEEGLDRFEFENNRPIYGNQVQTIRFDPVETDAIRIIVLQPQIGRDWTIGEIRAFGPAREEPIADEDAPDEVAW